jgi:hypothetical protein
MAITYNLSTIPAFNDVLNNRGTTDLLKSKQIKLKSNHPGCPTYNYKIISYDKHELSPQLIPSYGLCRSVIVNADNNVVGFSPPKSVSIESFIEANGEDNSNVIAEEFIEGTMINLFFDPVTNDWEIATRNTVGAFGHFFKSPGGQKTFREMFGEAALQNNMVVDLLEKTYCYSFVLQHPDNRMVVPFTTPQLYLVGLYEVVKDNNQDICVKSYRISEFKHLFSTTSVKFPETYNFISYAELVHEYCSKKSSFVIMGIILHNYATGERSKIRNPAYEEVKRLRGNQPKLQYQYLTLRREGKVHDFLKYYPEIKQHFSGFRYQVHEFTNILYANYISCYVKKSQPLSCFQDRYRTHMFHIHEIYKTILKPANQFVTKFVVQNYVNELHPSLLMHSLNLPLKQIAMNCEENNDYQHEESIEE